MARRSSASPITTVLQRRNSEMLTTQVRDLGRDLNELIQKHDGRDLTRAEIIRQLATEACVLIENDEALRHLWRALGNIVSMAVDHPQTVDQVRERDSAWAEQANARRRLSDRVVDARDEALDSLDQHLVATTFIDQAMVALQPGDDPVPALHKPAFTALKAARDALGHAADETALDLMWDLIRSRIRTNAPETEAA
jgi:hypothetical protein